MTLYQLTDDEAQVTQVIDLLDEVEDEEAIRILRENLNGTQEAIGEKLLAYALMIKNLKAEEIMCRNEARSFQERAQKAERKYRRMQSAVEGYFTLKGIFRAVVGKFVIKLQGNGGLAPLNLPEDPKELPQKYWKIEPDNEAIRADLDKGVVIPGVCYLERGKHVRVE